MFRRSSALIVLLVVAVLAGCGVELKDGASAPPPTGLDAPSTSTSDPHASTTGPVVPSSPTAPAPAPAPSPSTTEDEPTGIEALAERFRRAIAPANCENDLLGALLPDGLAGASGDDLAEIQAGYHEWSVDLHAAADTIRDDIDWGTGDLDEAALVLADDLDAQADYAERVMAAGSLDEAASLPFPEVREPDRLRTLLGLPDAADDDTDWCEIDD